MNSSLWEFAVNDARGEACSARRQALASYAILDTPPEEGFDRITRVAARLFGTPISLVTFADANRVWFKSCLGLDGREASSEFAFCTHALNMSHTLVIEDATADERFARNPLVTGPPHIRFYAGSQLRTEGGVVLGTLCVLGLEPRKVTPEDVQALEDLSRGVVAELDLRLLARRLESELENQRALGAELERSRRRLQDFLDASADLLWETDAELKIVSGGGREIAGVRFDDIRGLALPDAARVFPLGDMPLRIFEALEARKGFRQVEIGGLRPNGDPLWLEASGEPVFDGGFQGYRGVTRDITARKLMEQQVRRQAEEDPLTGLPNRRRFDGALLDVIGGSDDEDGAGLLLLDIDHFKQVNDTYGHDVGDLLVRGVAERISANIRADDTAARIGGDEFAIVLPHADEELLASVGRRIVAAMLEPFHIDGHVIQASLSVGGARLPKDGADAASALKAADVALYRSKHDGRARFSLYGAWH